MIKINFIFLLIALCGGSLSWADLVDSPSHCLEKQMFPCSLRVKGGFFAHDTGENRFHLGDRSALIMHSPAEVQLIEGDLWVRQSKDLTLRSSATLQMSLSGEWFFQKKGNLPLLARNLDGAVVFVSKYLFAGEALPVGFENWFGGLDSSGKLSRGMMKPIEIVNHLREWHPLTGYSEAELRKAARQYKESWKSALQSSADLYRDIVERRMASHEDKAAAQAESKRQKEAEQKKFRQMFRQKNGFE
jgi:hypothetical protein